MTFQHILDEIHGNIAKILDELQVEGVAFQVTAARPGFGDVSCNVAFLLAKRLKKSPREMARTISAMYENRASPLVKSVQAHDSGYVNYMADWSRLSELILTESFRDGYGEIDIGGGSAVTVEHTSVNPNKALHIGHIRNIVIGDVISRILQRTNHRVNVLNYVDDSGLQVADIIIGFRQLGFPVDPPDGKKFDQYCGDDVYVRTTSRYETDQSLKDLRDGVLQDMEDGKSETARFAGMITRRVLADQLRTCWNLGVTYDCLNFESQIVRSGLWSRTFAKLKEMKLVEYETAGENSGCWVIRGHNAKADKVLVRSNGTATYVAKDIPYAAWKLGLVDDPFGYEEYDARQPDGRVLWQTVLDESAERKNFAAGRVITVIDSRQARLQQLVGSLMSKFESDAYVHLGYESVTLSPDTARTLGLDTQGRQAQMSGRKGLYVNADSVYDLLAEKASAETAARHPEMADSEIRHIAHQVSVGALRYEMIRQDLDKMITFDLSRSLSLEGDTASYIQYTFARASRIMEKSGRSPRPSADFSMLSEPAELALIGKIGMFGIHVRDAARNLSPKVIARYCHDLAVCFNEFYERVRVLGLADRGLEDSRLCLVNSFQITLEKALDLLGIAAPRRM